MQHMLRCAERGRSITDCPTKSEWMLDCLLDDLGLISNDKYQLPNGVKLTSLAQKGEHILT
jgi:hypothetical protein